NPRATALRDYHNPTGQVTGFLLRSQLVSGWPRLGVQGYLDLNSKNEVPLLRMDRLAPDVLLCLFDGPVQMANLHEPPEQLQGGVEGEPGKYTTPILRELAGAQAGKQLPGGVMVDVTTRSADAQTLQIAAAAKRIKDQLGANEFTSAEWALEM